MKSASNVPGASIFTYDQERDIIRSFRRKTQMKNRIVVIWAAAALLALLQSTAIAHGGGRHVKLHVNPRWGECSFQLDPSLAQSAWRKFTREAGLVAYFRSLTAAKPVGVRNFEFSIHRWGTAIDDADPAWNDTFVHPDSTHCPSRLGSASNRRKEAL